MASITVPLDDKLYEVIGRFSWINWSEVAREETMKKEIFERFMKTGDLSDDDQKFCDRMDWYPVDELPLKQEFIEKLKNRLKEPRGKSMTVQEFGKWADSL